MLGSKMTAIIILVFSFGVLLLPIFEPDLGVYLSVAAVGFAVALQKYVASFAGYFVLRLSRLFNLGDRIRIGNIKGDVRHVGLLHFILDEVGEGDKFGGELTGRIIHIPNHIILDQPVLNFSRNFSVRGQMLLCDYMFDEVSIPLPAGVKTEPARNTLESILREEDRSFVEGARAMYGEDRPNFLEEVGHSPRVMVFMDAQHVWLVGKYVAPVRGRNDFKSRITVRFLRELEGESKGEGVAAETASGAAAPRR